MSFYNVINAKRVYNDHMNESIMYRCISDKEYQVIWIAFFKDLIKEIVIMCCQTLHM